MFAFPPAKRPLGLAASLLSLLMMMSVAGPAAADDGYLGVMLQEVSPSMGKALQLGDRPGVLVNEVVEDGPAAKAGLQDGDVILEVDGKAATNQAAVTKAVRAMSPGDKARVVVLRDGRQKDLTVELGKREAAFAWKQGPGGDKAIDLSRLEGLEGLEKLEGLEGLEGLEKLEGLQGLEDFEWFEDGDTRVMVLPKGEGRAPRIFFRGEGRDDDAAGDDRDGEHRVIVRTLDRDRGWLGVRMDALNGQLGEYFGVEEGAGVLVTEIVADSPAQKAGLRAGDVIVQAGDARIASPEALHKALAGTKAGQEIALEVLRKGSRQSLTVALGEMPGDDAMQRHVEIIGNGEGRSFAAPRMLRRMERLGRPGGEGDGEREIIIERRHDGDEDLSAVREEMEALRRELKQLREDLKR